MNLAEIPGIEDVLIDLRELTIPEHGWQQVTAEEPTPWGGLALVLIQSPEGNGAVVLGDSLFAEVGDDNLFPANDEVLSSCPPDGYDVHHYINESV